MSRDIVFDESRPFYPCPSSDASLASLVDPLSFLLFPAASLAPLSISRSTLPPSVSSLESPPVIPSYMVKPPVTQFYRRHGARLSDAPSSSEELSSDAPSSSSIEDVISFPSNELSSSGDSSPRQLIRRCHRLHHPADYYSPSASTITTLFEPTSYYDVILHPE
jgi:hypothetical protein